MTPTKPNCGAADATRWLLTRELFYTAVTRAKAKIDGGAFGNAEECIRRAGHRLVSHHACTTRSPAPVRRDGTQSRFSDGWKPPASFTRRA
jgi:hypothetical protein